MNVLITGGAGFIGSCLAQWLLQSECGVVILDNFNDYYDPRIKRANVAALSGTPVVIEGDVRDEALVAQLFGQQAITHVVHLAAMANVRYSVELGRLYADVNTTGSVVMMDAARKQGVVNFVLASTSSVYGNTRRLPFSEEDTPDWPLAPYPASKRAAELFAHSYHQLFDLNVTVLRFFNVYGPNGRPDMMPLKVIDSILNEKPITLYGEGKLERDWTFIDDTVSGIVAALERPLGYQIINLGAGAPLPFIDFIRIYEGLIGKAAITINAPAPRSEPQITYCDNTRARELLGFSPQTRIEEGLARTWAWYKTRHVIE